MNEKKKLDNKALGFALITAAVGIIGGIIIGMIIQQMIYGALLVEVAEGLEGTDIEINIDFNETMFLEGFKEVLNETMKENLNNETERRER